ncbi:tRNA (5-methylaminomethyl-2-thiouridine)(34)-methyltransferase MnmD [Lutibacter sp.]|uniref:tRNA (5-methylaminomethyl-2-thiouridine)(34)-methyltransferase MnmD n=1 Tax=Lutibacter sp. TaxID=1925666 RepID=UPI0025C06D81|nr:tRNA (5-methylaminomethyl-2-thiouridine)(34)-methyltransferase MnmD [Lutibacter sp.]MCF6181632.1 tRNA (5-methylaminomethyl-2-thiouridine)(34)-methyltransferase MnmD [Lutibacter sp.]
MKRKIILTKDGSTTIQLLDWDEQYHSKNGAIQEAKHVFIKQGLLQLKSIEISILEIGFGTGLNAFITFLEAQKRGLYIDYVGVEAYPVTKNELDKMNYVDVLNAKKHEKVFSDMHQYKWNEKQTISPNFKLTKRKQRFEEITDKNIFNLIYFDAFGAQVQPELWTETIFKKMYNALKLNGILVTYSAKGSVRRAMQSVGFTVERLPGPLGKREMLRAIK